MKGKVGQSCQVHGDHAQALHSELAAKKVTLSRKLVWNNHVVNTGRIIDSGRGQHEWRHVLLDCDGKQLKAKFMTRQEAYRRNKILSGSGFSWAVCSK